MICDTLASPLRKMTLRGANSLAKHDQPSSLEEPAGLFCAVIHI